MTLRAGYNVATESQGLRAPECPSCGGPVPPQETRRGRPKVHCSDRCRSRAYDRTHPRIPYQTDIFGLVEGRRRTQKAEAILDRLRQGPANTLELVRVGGIRFGARLHELRGEGHSIRTENQGDHAVYRLVEEAP